MKCGHHHVFWFFLAPLSLENKPLPPVEQQKYEMLVLAPRLPITKSLSRQLENSYRDDIRFDGWFSLCDVWFAFQAELHFVSLSMLQNLNGVLV